MRPLLRRRRKRDGRADVAETRDLRALAATLREEADMLELLAGLDPDTRTLAALRSLATVRDSASAVVDEMVVDARGGLGRGLTESEVAAAAGMSVGAVTSSWGRG